MMKWATAALCLVGCVVDETNGLSDQFTDPITTINGEVPEGELMPLQDSIVLLDTIQDDGNRLVVTKGTRLAGTRVGIHVHAYGGHTCVLSGVITDFVEGVESGTFPADTCYYMPANVPMSAANLGTEDAVLIDTFILPPGEPTITIVEPGWDF
jgi:hypothetical protein